MTNDILSEIHQSLPKEGSRRNEFMRKAFQMLPILDKPRVLDVGCGSGEPTLELAKLSQGDVIGLDKNQPALDELTKKIEQAGLSHRVKVVKCSMSKMEFPDESFDIIWAEGSIFVIGFEKGLKEWRRFLKPNGFLVVHEMVWLHPDPPQEIYDYWKRFYSGITTVQENLERIPPCGYEIIGYFALPEEFWWVEYYDPLEKRVQEFRIKYSSDVKALRALDKKQQEIDLFKKHCKWYGSAFFVMKKDKE